MSLNPSENVTGHCRPVAGVDTPTSVQEVVRLVQAARAAGSALYPVSTGLNFGYGGKSPPVDGCRLVDLSKMNRILNADQISLDNPVAVIEPGVTQAQLHEFLERHCPQLTFNVTGSARQTSILGNALDRGVGYFGPRREDLFGLEIVCGNSEIIYTGFRGPRDKTFCPIPADHPQDEGPLAHSHPYGLGPMLDGLFFQGNFGIVTSACFRLVPKQPCQVALSLALHDEANLGAFLDQLARMKRENLITSVTHVGNRARTHASLMAGMTGYFERECGFAPQRARAEAEQALGLVAPGEWASLGAVTGTPAHVRASLAEVRRRMKGLARVKVVTTTLLERGYALTHALRFLRFGRANAAAIAAIRPLHGLATGVPTDAAIDNLLWRFGGAGLPAARLDESRCGLVFINPALPMNGALVQRTIGHMKEVARGFGHALYITLNIETATSLVAVINLLFDRSVKAERDNAHACADALLACLHAEGLDVYRARADMMGDIVAHDPAKWDLVRRLKESFDPANIIAPGRYNRAQ
jgi:4-cresol dehydrogenase (hydroxylating)